MKLLLPPGIGDIHWCMLKMQSFAERMNGGKKPVVSICTMAGNKNRAKGYVDKLPFVEWGGYFDMSKHKREFLEAFTQGKIRGFKQFDYLYGYNTQVEKGLPPSEWWPKECTVNWHYPMQQSFEEGQRMERATTALSPYVLVSFYTHGWYQQWTNVLPPELVIEAIREVIPNATILITGAHWDRPVADALAKRTNSQSIAGKTTIEELCGLIRGAEAFVGHAAGNAMLAVHYRTPTVMLWSESKFKRAMWDCWAPPGEEHYKSFDLHKGIPTFKAKLEMALA